MSVLTFHDSNQEAQCTKLRGKSDENVMGCINTHICQNDKPIVGANAPHQTDSRNEPEDYKNRGEASEEESKYHQRIALFWYKKVGNMHDHESIISTTAGIRNHFSDGPGL